MKDGREVDAVGGSPADCEVVHCLFVNMKMTFVDAGYQHKCFFLINKNMLISCFYLAVAVLPVGEYLVSNIRPTSSGCHSRDVICESHSNTGI